MACAPSRIICDTPNCGRAHQARGLCRSCYATAKKRNCLPPKVGVRRLPDRICSIPDCADRHYAHGMCRIHYRRIRHGLDVDLPAKRPGPRVAPTGYIVVQAVGHPNAAKNGTILQHRLVMSRHLERPLYRDENVHHKNGDKQDNQLENLELWSTWQPSGQRVEDKIAYAKELLRRYEPDALSGPELRLIHGAV